MARSCARGIGGGLRGVKDATDWKDITLSRRFVGVMRCQTHDAVFGRKLVEGLGCRNTVIVNVRLVTYMVDEQLKRLAT